MIPISQPSIEDSDISTVNEALDSGWISSIGKFIDEFESAFAGYCGVKHAVSVSNGTVGLHLALVAAGISPGDEVIVPDLTFIATASAVKHAGATPIPVDVSRETYCIDPEAIENAITERTKAIIPVHLYGHPANMTAINLIAKKYQLTVIEDAAEAIGASIGSQKVGSLGDLGVFSFYGNKIITTGEGGMITTNDSFLDRRLRLLRDHAMSKEKRYWHDEYGFNYRMTNMQAALGVSQLKKIDDFLRIRAQILSWYSEILSPYGIELNPKFDSNPVNWLVCAISPTIQTRQDRDALMSRMRSSGVDTRPFFYPISNFPMSQHHTSNPISDNLSSVGLNLPTYTQLSRQDVELISEKYLKSMM